MIRQKEIYFYLHYKDALPDEEIMCIEKHARPWKYEVVKISKEEKCIIIKQLFARNTIFDDAKLEDIASNLGILPYVKTQPYQGFCLADGYPCNLCKEMCASFGNCKYSATKDLAINNLAK